MLSRWILLLIVPVIFWGFYWYIGFTTEYIKLIQFIGVLLLIIFLFKEIFLIKYKKKSYSFYVRLLILIIFISIINALLFWNQSPDLTYRAGISSFVVIYYFLLKKLNVTENEIIKLILILAIVHVLLWFYALSKVPNVVFGDLDYLQADRGFFRITQLNGLDIVCLLYFIVLSKLIGSRTYNKNILFWTSVTILLFVFIFLSLSRIIVFGILILTLYYILRKKTILFFVFTALLIWGSDFLMRNEIIYNFFSMTQNQITEGSENNLRIIEYAGFSKYYPWNVFTTIFGHGSPHIESSYGQHEEMLKYIYSFHRSDAGYVYLITTFGISGVLIYLLLGIKVFMHKNAQSIIPFKLFILFLFFISLTRNGFVEFGIGLAISIYILEKNRLKQESLNVE